MVIANTSKTIIPILAPRISFSLSMQSDNQIDIGKQEGERDKVNGKHMMNIFYLSVSGLDLKHFWKLRANAGCTHSNAYSLDLVVYGCHRFLSAGHCERWN